MNGFGGAAQVAGTAGAAPVSPPEGGAAPAVNMADPPDLTRGAADNSHLDGGSNGAGLSPRQGNNAMPDRYEIVTETDPPAAVDGLARQVHLLVDNRLSGGKRVIARAYYRDPLAELARLANQAYTAIAVTQAVTR